MLGMRLILAWIIWVGASMSVVPCGKATDKTPEDLDPYNMVHAIKDAFAPYDAAMRQRRTLEHLDCIQRESLLKQATGPMKLMRIFFALPVRETEPQLLLWEVVLKYPLKLLETYGEEILALKPILQMFTQPEYGVLHLIEEPSWQELLRLGKKLAVSYRRDALELAEGFSLSARKLDKMLQPRYLHIVSVLFKDLPIRAVRVKKLSKTEKSDLSDWDKYYAISKLTVCQFYEGLQEILKESEIPLSALRAFEFIAKELPPKSPILEFAQLPQKNHAPLLTTLILNGLNWADCLETWQKLYQLRQKLKDDVEGGFWTLKFKAMYRRLKCVTVLTSQWTRLQNLLFLEYKTDNVATIYTRLEREFPPSYMTTGGLVNLMEVFLLGMKSVQIFYQLLGLGDGEELLCSNSTQKLADLISRELTRHREVEAAKKQARLEAKRQQAEAWFAAFKKEQALITQELLLRTSGGDDSKPVVLKAQKPVMVSDAPKLWELQRDERPEPNQAQAYRDKRSVEVHPIQKGPVAWDVLPHAPLEDTQAERPVSTSKEAQAILPQIRISGAGMKTLTKILWPEAKYLPEDMKDIAHLIEQLPEGSHEQRGNLWLFQWAQLKAEPHQKDPTWIIDGTHCHPGTPVDKAFIASLRHNLIESGYTLETVGDR